jgi:hypothetical protein
VLPNDVKESTTLNAIQVRINENVRMLAELHARWEREDKMARKMKVCTITPLVILFQMLAILLL